MNKKQIIAKVIKDFDMVVDYCDSYSFNTIYGVSGAMLFPSDKSCDNNHITVVENIRIDTITILENPVVVCMGLREVHIDELYTYMKTLHDKFNQLLINYKTEKINEKIKNIQKDF